MACYYSNMQNTNGTYQNLAGGTQSGYIQTGEWGQPISTSDPTINPTSPMSVQPYGRGTPLNYEQPAALPQPLPEMPATLPGQLPQVQPEPLPETLTHHIYTPGYLRENIGQLCRVEFLVGSNVTDRVGYLREVGASYIVLEAVDLGSDIMCDLYSIKFVTILRGRVQQEIATTFTNL